jgi:enoyl-CoA hydratase/carnithine racemase
MPSSNVVLDLSGSIATLTFQRPHARNALTWDMYDALVDACAQVDATPAVRVFVIRGTGGAFSAGTDISQFSSFTSGDDGIAYERRLDAVVDRVERVSCATIAAIDGVAVGGGCAIAMACDFRICTTRARVGVPVARTLGNCLSVANLARLVDRVGTWRATDLVLSGRLLHGDELVSSGFANQLVPEDQFDRITEDFARQLASHAPSTVAATKSLLARIRDHRRPAPADDVIARCYGSAEFREGVRAFIENRTPRWYDEPHERKTDS